MDLNENCVQVYKKGVEMLTVLHDAATSIANSIAYHHVTISFLKFIQSNG